MPFSMDGQEGNKSTSSSALTLDLRVQRGDALARLDALEAGMAAVDERLAEIDARQAEFSGHLYEIQAQVQGLKLAATPMTSWTESSNDAILFGDAVTDASLYETGERTDKSMMFRIYGLGYDQILSLHRAGDKDSIALLNARATLKSKTKKAMPEEVEKAWDSYVLLLEDHWGQRPNTNPKSQLGQAYHRFWQALRQYKESSFSSENNI